MKLLELLHLLPNILRDPEAVEEGQSFIEAVLGRLGDLIPTVVNFFKGIFNGAVGIIYDSTAGEITVVGWLMLMGLGFGAFWFVFRWIRSLIRFK